MSTLPECVKCGNYIHSGFVVCDQCNDDLPTMRAELAAWKAEALAAREYIDMLEINAKFVYKESPVRLAYLAARVPDEQTA